RCSTSTSSGTPHRTFRKGATSTAARRSGASSRGSVSTGSRSTSMSRPSSPAATGWWRSSASMGDCGRAVRKPRTRQHTRGRSSTGPPFGSTSTSTRRSRCRPRTSSRADGGAPAMWSDLDDEVIGGDLTAALAYRTPAGGAVVTAVAPIGLRDRARGVVGFTTSLGLSRKLERIKREPRIALAYHARKHGFADGSEYVLVQGDADITLE